MMHRKFALVTSCALATLMSQNALGQKLDTGFDFAALRTAAWSLTARTSLRWRDGAGGAEPVVSEIECRGESPHMEFSMSGAGALSSLRIRFSRDVERIGPQEATLLGDQLWLYIDGERWEYANIPGRSTFSNFDYRKNEGGIVIGGWLGHQAVRKSHGGEWIHLSRFYERLIAAKRIEWGYKSRDWAVVNRHVTENQLPQGWETARYHINNAELRSAVSWCARQVGSRAPYVLPAHMGGKIVPDAPETGRPRKGAALTPKSNQ